MDKKGSFKPIIIVMFFSLLIVWLWDKFDIIKKTAHGVLDPSVGMILNWNVTYGMIIVVFFISVIITLVQKYTTNQEEIKKLKAEQKKVNEEAKKYRDNPAKLMEVQKNLMPLTLDLMKHSMRPIIFTGVPLILFFRWFYDYFTIIPDFRFFGFFSWLWFYLIGSIIFSIILRKIFKVQ